MKASGCPLSLFSSLSSRYCRDQTCPNNLSRSMIGNWLFFVHCHGGHGYTFNHPYHGQVENRLRTAIPNWPSSPQSGKPLHQAPETSEAHQKTPCAVPVLLPKAVPALSSSLLSFVYQGRRNITFSHSKYGGEGWQRAANETLETH